MIRPLDISIGALQVAFELGDVIQDIEEIADVVLELLNTDISTISNSIIMTFFAKAVTRLGGEWGMGKEPPAKVIDCLRNAKNRLADSDELSITLARTLLDRIIITYSNDDHEEGTTILNRFLISHDPDDEPSQYQQALHSISMFALVWLSACRKPEHLEETIYRFRNLLLGISLEDPNRPYIAAYLTQFQSMHIKAFGVGALQENDPMGSIFSGVPSFWDLIASLELERLNPRWGPSFDIPWPSAPLIA